MARLKDGTPYVAGSKYSKMAAKVASKKKLTQAESVLKVLGDHSATGATLDEIRIILGLFGTGISARVSELTKAGDIVDTGITRPSQYNQPQAVFRLFDRKLTTFSTGPVVVPLKVRKFTGTVDAEIIELLETWEKLSTEELEQEMDMSHEAISGNITRLIANGFVSWSATPSLNRSGCEALMLRRTRKPYVVGKGKR